MRCLAQRRSDRGGHLSQSRPKWRNALDSEDSDFHASLTDDRHVLIQYIVFEN